MDPGSPFLRTRTSCTSRSSRSCRTRGSSSGMNRQETKGRRPRSGRGRRGDSSNSGSFRQEAFESKAILSAGREVVSLESAGRERERKERRAGREGEEDAYQQFRPDRPAEKSAGERPELLGDD